MVFLYLTRCKAVASLVPSSRRLRVEILYAEVNSDRLYLNETRDPKSSEHSSSSNDALQRSLMEESSNRFETVAQTCSRQDARALGQHVEDH